MMREGGDSSEDRDTAVCIFVYLQRDDRIQHHYRHRVKSQGMKQLMAGAGVAVVGMVLVPLLSGLFSV